MSVYIELLKTLGKTALKRSW